MTRRRGELNGRPRGVALCVGVIPDGSVKVTPRMRTNGGDTCRVAALRHRGIVLQSIFMVGHDLFTATRVECKPAHRAMSADPANDRRRGVWTVSQSGRDATSGPVRTA